MLLGHSPDSQTIVDKAKLYTNSVHGLNSPANRVAEFLIGKNSKKVCWLISYLTLI